MRSVIANIRGAHACSVLVIAFRDYELLLCTQQEEKFVSAECQNQQATSVRPLNF